MLDEWYAHTPTSDHPERWHRLLDHLHGVAQLAYEFGAAYGAGDVCRLLGLVHDIGKADPRFQRYLRESAYGKQARSVPHATAGALAVCKALGPFALAVAGHHSGLLDKSEWAGVKERADCETVRSARAVAAVLGVGDTPPTGPPAGASQEGLDLLVRMCFSALVDADWLDTEQHFKAGMQSERGGYPALDYYVGELAAYLAMLASKAPKTVVNQARNEVLDACHKAALSPQGAYRLTVPTGGGKTLSSLSFAFDHAIAHDLRRVIVAIPYTSIIDQTAEVYESVFGRGKFLEHHSAVDVNPTEDECETRQTLAAENWDCPLIVTTTVQLFDSLFSNRPARCRKLHNLAASVIVLDEAQTLPPGLLGPILDVLSELVAHYRCTLLFCSATQPDYSGLNNALLAEATEIVEEPTRLFSTLRRVAYRFEPTQLSYDELAERLAAQSQTLCILNTRRDAVAVVRRMAQCEGVFHLSTLLCADHRKRVLREVRERLSQGLPVRLVSTQVVEAGVDLDFPSVYRVVGPLDRIVQAAGRCNREGRLDELGALTVFELENAGAPRGWYSTAIARASEFVRKDINAIEDPAVVAAYFRKLYKDTSVDSKNIRPLRKELHFRTVAQTFQMIDDETVPLLVRSYNPEAVNELLRVPPERRDRRWYRVAATYSVSVPVWQAQRMEVEGSVRVETDGVRVYDGVYDNCIGIGVGDEPDPADLVIA